MPPPPPPLQTFIFIVVAVRILPLRSPTESLTTNPPTQGVSGSGKSTIGKSIAAKLGLPFLDGDDLHPKENVEKLGQGEPLTDEDRGPWLLRIREEAIKASIAIAIPNTGPYEQGRRPTGLVVACSALKKAYRDVLRGAGNSVLTTSTTSTSREYDIDIAISRCGNPLSATEHEPLHSSSFPTILVYLTGSRDTLSRRMECRKGHFMKANMLDSQIRALEPPTNDEKSSDVIQVDFDTLVDPEAQVEFALSAMTHLTGGTICAMLGHVREDGENYKRTSLNA